MRCHINSGFPLILGADIYSGNTTQKYKGSHAITILGYNHEDNSIYVHDDRIGTFVKALIIEFKADRFSDKLRGKWGLELQEKDDDGNCQPFPEYFLPTSLIIPTPQKARLGYTYAKKTCDLVVKEYKTAISDVLQKTNKGNYAEELEFDIQLREISDIRQAVITQECQSNSPQSISEYETQKKKFLTGSYARYQWVASFTLCKKDAFKIYFDATDIPQGEAISFIFIENQEAAEAVLTVFRKYAEKLDERIPDQQNTNFYSSFLKYLVRNESNRATYLDKTYGELRAPKYLKEEEVIGDPEKGNTTVIHIYDSTNESLNDIFEKLKGGDANANVLWAISHDGILLVGREIGNKGHPTLTGFKAARIAGELKHNENKWVINSKSGRYSGDYENNNQLLENVRKKINSIFFCSSADENISIENS